jgi:hypothetical protein
MALGYKNANARYATYLAVGNSGKNNSRGNEMSQG